MHFFIIVLIIGFIVFLFTLYLLSHDDFVFLKNNIALDRVFNIAFIAGFLAFVFSRALYVFDNPSPALLSPLGFIVFPYFPGLSVIGGVAGASLIIFVMLRNKDIPSGRIMDFISFSFITAAPIGLVGMFILNKGKIALEYFLIQLVGYLIFLVFSYIIFIRKEIKASNDGRYCSIFIIFFSIMYVIINFIHLKSKLFFTLDFAILASLLVIALLFMLKSVFKSSFPKIK